MEACVRQDIHLAVEQLFEVLAKADKIHERAAGFHVHQEIDVTFWPRITPRDRSEDTDISSTVSGSDPHDLASLFLKVHVPMSANIVARETTTS